MPPRNWRLRIEDILENIADIETFIAGMDYDAFAADRRTVNAVLRSFEIIGEAAGFVPPEVQARYPDVPWRTMRGTRNVISHAYFDVSLPLVWETIGKALPPLRPRLREILANEPEDPTPTAN